MSLCTGDKGKAKGSGRPLSFRDTPIHRIVPNMFCQGGDFVHGNGTGGESIWGGQFKDEKGGLAVKLDRRGLLAMSNKGKNTNGSQWFITFRPLPALNGAHVVFGELDMAKSEAALQRVEAAAGGPDERPRVPVIVVASGVLTTG